MAKKTSAAVWIGGGVAAFAGYEFLLKPFLAAKTAAGGGSSLLPGMWTPGAGTPGVSTPTILPGAVMPGGVQGSIVDPRVNPGGDVGQAMWRKGWTQLVAKARLDALKSAYSQARGMVQQLKSPAANPAAVGIPAAQQALAQVLAAAANADQQQALAVARGDQAAATGWAAAAATHRQDASEIQARIAAASAPVMGDAAAVAKWEGAAAGHAADYMALTGLTIPGG